MANKVDLEALIPRASITISPPESDGEHQARLDREKADADTKRDNDRANEDQRRAIELADANHKRLKDKWVFVGGGTLSAIVILTALGVAIFAKGDLQKWAMGFVSPIIAAVVSFLVGRASASPTAK